MTPEEIREIRKALKLTQAEAGTVLGGGPRAFAKYEAGVVEPSAGLVKLLRLLESDPSAVTTVGGEQLKPRSVLAGGPFASTGEDVTRLREWETPQFVRSILYAEAEANGLPADSIHVAEQYSVPDGGEDAHIRWEDGPARTQYLPSRYTQFQIKTGAITPTKAGREVLTEDGNLKGMIRAALEAGAHYVLLCTTPLTAKKAQAMAEKIRESIQAAPFPVDLARIHVWDADQIAAWVNRYPPVAARLRERTNPGSIGPFRSWIQWANRTEHDLSPLVDDPRLVPLRARLLDDLVQTGKAVRVVGPAGVGKSRLVLESLCTDDPNGLRLDEFVLYADTSEVAETAIRSASQTLADTAARAVVVVDDCPPETHDRIAEVVAGPRSRLSLVTIDSDDAYTDAHRGFGVRVDFAPPKVTEAIVDRELPGLPSEDRRRLLLFSHGFPAIAIRVARAWAVDTPMPYSTETYFVDAFVSGRNDPEPKYAIRTAMLVAAFGAIRQSPSERSQIAAVVRWARGMTAADMHAALERLVDRSVVQRRGGLLVLQPLPVAMRLTERQWREWTPEQWTAILAGDIDADLKRNAARQLAWANDTEIAKNVVDWMLAPGGPIDGFDRLREPGIAGVLYHLAKIDALLAADCIRRAFDDIADLRMVQGDVRRELVGTLERIAFPAASFDEAARLMLLLAMAETEDHIANNATGQLAALFPMLEGATAADGKSRTAFLRDIASTDDPRQRAVVVKALQEGIKTAYFFRLVGAETHGSRPALEPWRPANTEEASSYVATCVQFLAQQATIDDEIGMAARAGLGHELRGLTSFGLFDVVEEVVGQVLDAVGSWPEAIESIGHFIRFDAADASTEVVERARRLIERLQPTTLSDRIRNLVSNMPWDYPNDEELEYEKQVDRQLETVRTIAAEALGNMSVLADNLPQLCCGSQRWAGAFGEFLGLHAEAPDDWLRRIEAACRATPDEDRNFDLLSGFLKGMSKRDGDAVDAFKRRVAESDDLARALPAICSRLGIVTTDIRLAVDALHTGRLPPSSLRHWAIGSVLSSLPTERLGLLFDELRGRHEVEGVLVVVELVDMLAHGSRERLEDLRFQILELANALVRIDLPRQGVMVGHHAKEIFTWLLAKGRGDSDARSLALTLADGLADDDVSSHTVDLLSPVLPLLLSKFPEISWPLIGQQIVGDTVAAWRLREHVAGTISGHRPASEPPIMSLPPDTLVAWCSAYPEEAPACAARVLPILATGDGGDDEMVLHPLFKRLLDQFGDREDVLEATLENIHTFGWTGSLTTYFGQYLRPLESLRNHSLARVARWANRTIRQLGQEIERTRNREEEREAGWGI